MFFKSKKVSVYIKVSLRTKSFQSTWFWCTHQKFSINIVLVFAPNLVLTLHSFIHMVLVFAPNFMLTPFWCLYQSWCCHNLGADTKFFYLHGVGLCTKLGVNTIGVDTKLFFPHCVGVCPKLNVDTKLSVYTIKSYQALC